MIIKARCIAHVKESLNYIVKEEKNHVYLASDGIDTTNVKTMLSDFSIYNNAKVKNGFISVVISPNKLDQLKHRDYEGILKATLSELNLENRQFVSVMHLNTKNPHIHVILNRIDYENITWKDSHIAWKCQAACKSITKDLNLRDAYQSENKELKTPLDNVHDKQRFEAKQRLQVKVRRALFISTDMKSLHSNLSNQGVEIEITKFKNGLYGTTLVFEGNKFKASKINRNLSVNVDGQGYGPKDQLKQLFEKNALRISGKLDNDSIFESLTHDPEMQKKFIEDIIEQHTFTSKLGSLLDDALDDNDAEIDYLAKRKKALNKKPTVGKSRGMN